MHYELADAKATTPEAAEAAKQIFRDHGLNCPS
jgi:hypothetical protein